MITKSFNNIWIKAEDSRILIGRTSLLADTVAGLLKAQKSPKKLYLFMGNIVAESFFTLIHMLL